MRVLSGILSPPLGTSVAVPGPAGDGVRAYSFDPARTPPGAGLTNLSDRVAAVGGALRIDARPGRGTHISGDIPASPTAQ